MKKQINPIFNLALPYLIPGLSSLLFLALLAAQVLVRPVTGLADNGDFIRFLMPAGIFTMDSEPERQYGNWVNLKYRDLPTFARPGESHSSEMALVYAAVKINRLFSERGYFDIRVLGGLHLLLYWLAVSVLLFQTRYFSRIAQAFLCAVILLVFSDVGYTQYLNSFYSEPMAMVTFAAVAAVSLAVSLRPPPARLKGWVLALLTILVCLLVTAKPPFSLFGFILLPWLARVYFSILRFRKPVFAALMVTAVLAGSLFSLLFSVPQIIKSANSYNTIFLGILHRSPNPYADLVDLGFSDPGKLASFRMVSFWTPEIQAYYENNPVFQNEIKAINHFDILGFYIRHPDRLHDLAKAISKYTFFTQVPYLGHYEIDSGKPALAMVDHFHAWSDLRAQALPGNLVTVLIVMLVNLTAALICRFWLFRSQPFKYLPEFHLAVLAVAAATFAVTVLGEGTADVVRHLFFTNMALDFCLILLLFYVLLLVETYKDKIANLKARALLRAGIPHSDA